MNNVKDFCTPKALLYDEDSLPYDDELNYLYDAQKGIILAVTGLWIVIIVHILLHGFRNRNDGT